MAPDHAGRRYRTLYATLLRLYPRPFHDRFGQSMEQTFHDLCREPECARRELFGFVTWIFCETLADILRENMTRMSELGKTTLRVALVALGLLMVPLVASRMVAGWNWRAESFVIVYLLFFATGMAYAMIARKMGAWSYKADFGVALAAGFALGWSNMVHVADSENPGEPALLQRPRGWGYRGLTGADGTARVGPHALRNGGDARADRGDAALGCPTLSCAEYGDRAFSPRGVVHHVRSIVPAREFGGI